MRTRHDLHLGEEMTEVLAVATATSAPSGGGVRRDYHPRLGEDREDNLLPPCPKGVAR